MAISRREAAVEYLKAHSREDLTTNEVALALDITREQAAQTLHGLMRHGLGGQLRRTGQSTWIYQPPTTASFQANEELATKVPVGFRGYVQITARIGDWYLGALVDPTDGFKDRGMRLWVKPVIGDIEIEMPQDAQYEYSTPLP